MSRLVSARVDFSDAARVLDSAMREVGNPARLMRKVAGDVAKLFRANFRRLNNTRSRYGHEFYLNEGARVTRYEASSSGDYAAVIVASAAMAHKLRGGTVRPKNAQSLAIPVSEWAKSQKRNPGDIPGLDFFVLPGNRAALAREDGDGIDYILVKSVTHKPRPETIPDSGSVARTVKNACEEYILSIAAGGGE